MFVAAAAVSSSRQPSRRAARTTSRPGERLGVRVGACSRLLRQEDQSWQIGARAQASASRSTTRGAKLHALHAWCFSRIHQSNCSSLPSSLLAHGRFVPRMDIQDPLMPGLSRPFLWRWLEDTERACRCANRSWRGGRANSLTAVPKRAWPIWAVSLLSTKQTTKATRCVITIRPLTSPVFSRSMSLDRCCAKKRSVAAWAWACRSCA